MKCYKIETSKKLFDEWTTNPELPMEHLGRYRHLVSAQWVNSLISGDNPQHYDNIKYVILHAHYRNREAYLSGHIPGATDIDTLALKPGTGYHPKNLKQHWNNTVLLLTLQWFYTENLCSPTMTTPFREVLPEILELFVVLL